MSTEEGQVSEAIETKAKSLGWKPKDNFKGNPDEWIDAQTFVENGEKVMPILRANNRRLEESQTALKAENASIKEALAESKKSIDALVEFNTSITREKAAKIRADLLAELKSAKESGNVDAEVAITDRLTEHKAAEKEAVKEAKTEEKKTVQTPADDPEFAEWKGENPWFGEDVEMTALANGVAQRLRNLGEKAKGRAFLDKVTAGVNKRLGTDTKARSSSKVESGHSSEGSGGASGAKTFADLPADAKEYCNSSAERFVGPGKSFKTQAEWRSHYVNKYFE